MKRIILLLVVCIPLISFAQTVDKDIVGKWKGVDPDGTDTIFIFDKDGYAQMGYGKLLVGGKDFNMNGEKVSFIYKLNLKVKPMHLDLIVENFTKGEKMIMPMIFEFVDKDHLKILGDDKDSRPVNFTKESIIFDRVE